MAEVSKKRINKIEREKNQEDFIKKIKNLVKKEEAYIDFCEEYNLDLNFIDSVSVEYDDELEVSAKTVNGDIFLNGKLFDKGDVCDNVRYLIHETTHVAQQANNLVNEQTANKDYLDDPNEQEAFQYQIQYMYDHVSEEEIQEYLEHLLDHHEITNRKERLEKIKKLTENI